MDDREIIKLFYERSEQGVVELSKKYGRLCRQVARNFLQDEADIEECINDVFLDIWNLIPPEDPDDLCSLLCSIVRKKAVNRYKRNNRQKRNSTYDIALHELDECIENGVSVEKAIEDKELSRIIDGFLESLDKISRIIFVCRYWYSDSVTEIAKKINKTPAYVSVRLARLREKLKKRLIEEGVFYNEKS